MDDPVAPCAVSGAAHQWEPHIGVRWRCHLRRHYPDYGGAQVVKSNGSSNHARIALKHARPEMVTDHGEKRTARLIFFFRERSTELGRQADYLEKVCCDNGRTDLLRTPSGNLTQGHGFVPSERKVFENGVVMPPVEVVRE